MKYVKLDDDKIVDKKKEEEAEQATSQKEYALLALNKKSNLFDPKLRSKVEALNDKLKGNPVSKLINVVNYWMDSMKKDEDKDKK